MSTSVPARSVGRWYIPVILAPLQSLAAILPAGLVDKGDCRKLVMVAVK